MSTLYKKIPQIPTDRFHLDNTVNSIIPIRPGLGVTLANNATTLQAGQSNLLILDSLAANVALVGAMIHARDAAGTPVGSFSDAGGIFVGFPGCGKNAQGKLNGVVHSTTITENVRCNSCSCGLPLKE